jgi:hypothetical protein
VKAANALACGMGRIRHRARQFVETLTAPFWPIDVAEAAVCVQGAPDAASLVQLFLQMPRAEQRHGLLVCRRLRARGFTSPDLLAAGLLHDAGKSVHPPRLWERVAVVLLEHYLPGIARWLSVGHLRVPFFALPGSRLRQAFRVRRCHPCWGAKLAAGAGATPRTVSLIRRHHVSSGLRDEDGIALHNADET